MITRIYEGTSQTQHVVTAHRHHSLSAVPGQIRLAYAHKTRWRGAGRWRVCSQDPPHGCCTYVVAEPGEFPVHPAIPLPGR